MKKKSSKRHYRESDVKGLSILEKVILIGKSL